MTEATGSRENLDLGISDHDIVTLKPAKVKIVRVEVISVGKEKKAKKLVCFSKHPDKDELIELSNVKYIDGEKITVSGLWVNMSDDGKLQKNSVLAQFMKFMNATLIKDLEGKECETVLNDKYLTIKGYN